MSDCGVCIGGGDYDGEPEFHNVSWPKARKQHRCGECRRDIPKGSQYEKVSGKYDGAMYSEKTCCDCAEIRSAFVCDGAGPVFGEMWNDLTECFRDLSTTCFDRLESVSAKKYLRDRWMKWKGLAA